MEASSTEQRALARLLELPAVDIPATRPLAVELLHAGPAATAVFFEAFEDKALAAGKSGRIPDGLARLGRRLQEVPRVIDQTLAESNLPGTMRNTGIGVALEIMRRDANPETLNRAVRLCALVDASDRAGLRDLAPRLKALAKSVAQLNFATVRELAELVQSTDPALRNSIADGIAEGPIASLAALQLIGVLDHVHGMEGVLLNRVERVARRKGVRLTPDQAAPVRQCLGSLDAFVRREAAFSSGSINDQASIESLIGLLDDPVPTVRYAAHDSLCRLTSMTISADPYRWKLWFDDQRAWWQDRGQAAVAAIPTASLGDLVDLIAEASTKRLYRDKVAEALILLAEKNDPRHVEMAISALGNLRAPSGLATIEAHLQSPSPKVAQRAAAALRSLKSVGIRVRVPSAR